MRLFELFILIRMKIFEINIGLAKTNILSLNLATKKYNVKLITLWYLVEVAVVLRIVYWFKKTCSRVQSQYWMCHS